MTPQYSTANPVPSRRDVLINGAAMAVAGALSTVTVAARGRTSASAFLTPDKGEQPRIKPGAQTFFGPLKQIEAGLLNVGYAETGLTDGQPVLLLPTG